MWLLQYSMCAIVWPNGLCTMNQYTLPKDRLKSPRTATCKKVFTIFSPTLAFPKVNSGHSSNVIKIILQGFQKFPLFSSTHSEEMMGLCFNAGLDVLIKPGWVWPIPNWDLLWYFLKNFWNKKVWFIFAKILSILSFNEEKKLDKIYGKMGSFYVDFKWWA